MNGLKLFHASDLHFGAGYFDYILALQDKFDIFVLVAIFYTKRARKKKSKLLCG